jgi:hypothetical protein
VSSFAHSTGQGRANIYLDASEQIGTTIVPDTGGAGASDNAGSANSTTVFATSGMGCLGTTVDWHYSLSSANVRTTGGGTLNVNTKALNNTTIGASRIAGVAAQFFKGDLMFVAQWAGGSPNWAQFLMVVGMAKEWFAAG